jgi:hypothetical protein
MPSDQHGCGKQPVMKPLRLTTVIEREMGEVGNFHALAKRINDANVAKGIKASVEHRTLDKIVNDPDKVRLSRNQLIALDTYLSPKGEGLDDQPILEKLGILHCVANPKRKVVFLVGAKPRPRAHRCDLSPWDMRSTAKIVQELSIINPHVQHEIVDVLLCAHRSETDVRNEPWHALLDDGNHMLVSIGSPLACVASEVMLARMFKKSPFQAPTTLDDGLPFYFIWPPKRCGRLRSCFALPGQSIPATPPGLRRAVMKNKASAFYREGKFSKVTFGGKRWDMYSIIAAQRRKLGQVWVVIAGQTGPATFAAATKLNEITESLPWTAGQDGPVLWTVVQSRIQTAPEDRQRGDDRSVMQEWLGTPKIWGG